MNKAHFRRVREDGTVRFEGFAYTVRSTSVPAGTEVLVVPCNEFREVALHAGWIEALPNGRERVHSGKFLCYARLGPMARRWDDKTGDAQDTEDL